MGNINSASSVVVIRPSSQYSVHSWAGTAASRVASHSPRGQQRAFTLAPFGTPWRTASPTVVVAAVAAALPTGADSGGASCGQRALAVGVEPVRGTSRGRWCARPLEPLPWARSPRVGRDHGCGRVAAKRSCRGRVGAAPNRRVGQKRPPRPFTNTPAPVIANMHACVGESISVLGVERKGDGDCISPGLGGGLSTHVANRTGQDGKASAGV